MINLDQEPADKEASHGHVGEPKAPMLISMLFLLGASSGLCLSLRLFAKRRKNSRIWWDDALLVLAWILVAAQSIIVVSNIIIGFGDQVDSLTAHRLQSIGLLNTVFATLAVLGWVMSRCSVALMLSQVMDGGLRPFMLFVMTTVSLLGAGNVVFWWTKCSPVEWIWIPWHEGSCSPEYTQLAVVITTSGYAAIVDFVLCGTPWFLVWNHRLAMWERFGLGSATATGLLAAASCIMKGVRIPKDGTVDKDWTVSTFFIWACSETALVIVAASIPVFRIFFVREPSQADWGRRLAPEPQVRMVTTPSAVSPGADAKRSGSTSDDKFKSGPRVRFMEITREEDES
ncbi:hypothetical protein MKZ38_002395 [Zalerion maritima]|uniref:Rhodopsin domain-containing protein n=1 Tax=Zalerion maritima TaxID=339359 RepID=A0AAD5RQG0_9PEZI|nr:hypothetical protein MKZ38_002395 [Zalerion maritima]